MTKNDAVPAGENPEVETLRADLEKYFAFLRDFSTETRDPALSRMTGYSYGYAMAKLEDGDPAAAAKQLAWMVNRASRHQDAPGYPGPGRADAGPRSTAG
ncbi:hypothetical protein [Streptomyces sp. AC1-42T]|uniref:hypothetical protein n=1 Tax=Streptomyces sp. AC1-42T TaxID=2218665 RepID=UPI000DAB6235|nr:hypothetical protein [Streptomyces sp. AC1-42T]PZT71460.1 hypothetical protein DNK55_32625 [Streptomyces sp. AC1-42T]